MTLQAAASLVLPATHLPAMQSQGQSPITWLLTAALLLAIACGDGQATATTNSGDGVSQMQGHILNVVARNITEIESVSIRDQEGKRWAFTTEGFSGMTPAHLRQHQLFGQQVVVSYVEKKDRLVAVNIGD